MEADERWERWARAPIRRLAPDTPREGRGSTRRGSRASIAACPSILWADGSCSPQDLSDASREAEARGIELAETPGARLLILAIVRPETTGNVPQQKRLAALLRLARRRGRQAEGRLLTDRPAESILLVAAATGTDVIVMGCDQWRGWAAGADASGHVVLHAPCPVLIARASRAAWPAPSPGYDRPHIALEHAIPKQSAEGERIPPR